MKTKTFQVIHGEYLGDLTNNVESLLWTEPRDLILYCGINCIIDHSKSS